MNEIISNVAFIADGMSANLLISVVSAVFALVIGTVLAAMRVSPVPVLRALGKVYVDILRNTPLTLVLLFCGLGIGDTLRVQFSEQPQTNGFWIATMGLSAYTAAFVCETLRSGVNTIPMGQAEAARSIGLTFGQTLREVVLPQAVRSTIPPLINVLIALTKNTSVAAGFATVELIGVGRRLSTANAGDPWVLVGVAAFYLVITIPAGLLASALERRVAFAR